MKHLKTSCLLAMIMIGTAAANDLDDQLKHASGKVAAIAHATPDELQRFTDALKGLFNGGSSGDWQQWGLTAHTDKDIISLQELPTAKQGRGLFAINPHAPHNWLLQAPHADSDLYTGKIASRLFLEGGFKAVQWNTVKRDISDMAHTPDTYWQAFTQAFAQNYPDGKIVQLHGFEQGKRASQAGEASDMIVSAGHSAPPQWVQQTAACLKNAFPDRVSLYQFDVKELGGTTNVQGQLLRSLGHDGFLHIEMSKTFRQTLLDHADVRGLFLKCL